MQHHPQALRRPICALVRYCYYHSGSSIQQPAIARIPSRRITTTTTTRTTTSLMMKNKNNSPHHDSTTTRLLFSTEQGFNQPEEDEVEDTSFPNPGLASVITQGLGALESTAAHIESKTSRFSLDQTPSARHAPSHRQLAEGHRILQVVTEVLDYLCDGENNNNAREDYEAVRYLMAADEPISILDVQVNRDLKQAKVFWTLPYGVLLDDRMWSGGDKTYRRLIKALEPGIETHGQKLLSKHVINRLRSYYPPRLRMVPATDAMVKQAVEEMMI
jgi:ribosome-binding factor A